MSIIVVMSCGVILGVAVVPKEMVVVASEMSVGDSSDDEG